MESLLALPGKDDENRTQPRMTSLRDLPKPLRMPAQSLEWLTAALLFAATFAVVLWKNTHHVVLWDLSYALDTSWRIAQGQLPYRDFPLAHAPVTFLLQATIIHLFGRHFLLHALYAAVAGALATLLTWRIVQSRLGTVPHARLTAFLLASPLCFLGIYSILPLPFYDCDCVLLLLLILLLAEKMPRKAEAATGRLWPAIGCGVLLPLPIFVKQNIGLPLFALAFAMLCLLLLGHGMGWLRLHCQPRHLLALLASSVASLLVCTSGLAASVGLGNYLHWTVGFAASRRMPGLGSMLEVYQEPLLLYWLPAVAVALLLLHWRGNRLWARSVALALMALPFCWTLVLVLMAEDADDRTSALLALWPFLLLLAGLFTAWKLLRRTGGVLSLLLLVAIHGTLLSQQLWGSTYAIWPLCLLLVAEMLRELGAMQTLANKCPSATPLLAGIIALTLLVGGGIYSLSCERLSYAHSEGEPQRISAPGPLNGIGAPGNYLAAFDELLDFAQREIPARDGIILLPGEDPFYFASGRLPRFPVLLFDPATDPYSPLQLREQARSQQIRWLIVKTDEQIKADPMPERDASLALLLPDFRLDRQLTGYAIYRRR